MVKVIAFHVLHDANVTVCVDGEVQVVLELERLFQVRYFCSAPKKANFREQWKRAIDVVTDYTGITRFDVAVTSWVMPSKKAILQELVNSDRWISIDHHLCHATLGFYDSPFESALILSYDGGGNDGTFNVYLGNRDRFEIKLFKKLGLNLGTPYRQLATCMPEVTGKAISSDEPMNYMRFAPLALSGKVMGYAALGKVHEEWRQPLYEYYEWFINPLQALFTLGERIDLCLEPSSLDKENARDLAASSQRVFEELVCTEVEKCLETLCNNGNVIDGIVLTGGCALNVHTNYIVTKKFGYPVHVPPAPNDCGITVGAVWQVTPPKKLAQIQYIGLPLEGLNDLDIICTHRKAKKVTIDELAEILVNGAIVGIARGRQEFGPRALGHRSIVCYPNSKDLRDKVNRIKSREWYRPLCPSVTIEYASAIFEACSCSESKIAKSCIPSNSCRQGWIPVSPYMSFALPLTEEAKERFPAICHFDGTARVQTVRKDTDPWYHSLLVAVGKKCNGGEVLMNTSFNIKGKPILNNVSTALQILDSNQSDSLDYILIEDFLFKYDLS